MIEVEVRTNKGQIDAVACCENCVFIFEFKLNKSAAEAMEQIRSRDYYQKYRLCGKSVFLLGVSIDTEKGELLEWLVERER